MAVRAQIDLKQVKIAGYKLQTDLHKNERLF